MRGEVVAGGGISLSPWRRTSHLTMRLPQHSCVLGGTHCPPSTARIDFSMIGNLHFDFGFGMIGGIDFDFDFSVFGPSILTLA